MSIRRQLFLITLKLFALAIATQAAATLRKAFPGSYRIAHLHIRVATRASVMIPRLQMRRELFRIVRQISRCGRPVRASGERFLQIVMWAGGLYCFALFVGDAQEAYARFLIEQWVASR
ncbi:MAG: hypothetical protein REI09_05335 [Candidatus Dactylopiibacterium sp.]|nr:hypothetical protein [Candidatus Dactylopiibacterium sp.]